jgi:hypothetical protein
MSSTSPTRVARLERGLALRWCLTISVLLTVLFIAVLSVRMAAGADPALGPKLARESSGSAAQPSSSPATPVPQVPTVPVQPAPAQTVPAQPVPVPPAPVQTTTS